MDHTDYGTPELAKRQVVTPELTGKGHQVRMRVRDGSAIDRLLYAGDISDSEYSVLSSFAKDCHAAGMSVVSSMNMESGTRISTSTKSDHTLTAMRKVGQALRHVEKEVGKTCTHHLLALVADNTPFDAGDSLSTSISALSEFYDQWRGRPRQEGLSCRIRDAGLAS